MDDTQPEAAQQPAMTREELQRLTSEANAGSEPARARLREWLDATPAAWRAVGDLGGHAETAVRDAISRQDYLHGECLRRSAEALRKSLLAEDATPIEQLSVQRLVVSWLQLQLADMRLAAADGSTARSSFSIRAAESAQRRFSSAMSQWQSLQKLLGRPACRAAIADVLDRGTQASTADAGSPVGQAEPRRGPTTIPEPIDRSHTASTGPAVAEPLNAAGENSTPPPNAPIELSGILPFRMTKPASDQ